MNPLYQKSYPDSSRGLMAALWGASLAAYVSNDPQHGYRYKSDFLTEEFKTTDGATASITGTTAVTSDEGWAGQDAVTAGGTYTVSIQAGKNGVMRVASNGTTEDFGAEVSRTHLQVVTPKHATTPCRKLTYQTRLDLVAVDGQALALLTDAAVSTPVAGANDAIADVGYIGFQVRENGDLYFVTKSAASGVSDSVLVLANANWAKLDPHNLGFSVDRTGAVAIVVDGKSFAAAAATINPASIPTGNLSPRYACTTSGSVAASMDVDMIDVFCEE